MSGNNSQKDYIENLKVLAGVHMHFVSSQNLDLLREKYGLSDPEFEEMKVYCKEYGITVYDEEKGGKDAAVSAEANIIRNKSSPTKGGSLCEEVYNDIIRENKENLDRIHKIARCIMRIASTKARRGVKGLGWVCGTYANSVRKSVEVKLKHSFTRDQLQFIIDHLPSNREADEAECFSLTDPKEQKMCDEMSIKLNELIPKLHVNISYSSLLDDK